jgi:hypothetical protein
MMSESKSIVNAFEAVSVSDADVAYANFTRSFNSGQFAFEQTESMFLKTRANTVDQIINKLELAKEYLDISGLHSHGEITHVVIGLVRKGKFDDALYYAEAITTNDSIDDMDYCLNPILSAISDLELITSNPAE